MKRLLLSVLAVCFVLAITYNAQAGTYAWRTAASLVITNTTSNCQHPVLDCHTWNENHWIVRWNNSYTNCNNQAPKYSGTVISAGNWYTAGAVQREYQLTKSWMATPLTGHVCLDATCNACTQTSTYCPASNFTAYCYSAN